MTFKGVGQASVIRKASEKCPETSLEMEPEIYQKIMSSYDESREKHQAKRTEEKPQRPPPSSTYFKNSKTAKAESEDSAYVTPKFTVTHQSDIDLQDFRDCMDAKIDSTIPKKLIIVVDLPLLKSATDASLDVQERSLSVTSEKPAKYRLELPLSYCVDAENGNAKFDTKYKKLTITLPVIRKHVKLSEARFPTEDSGVDSDHGSPLMSSSDEIMENSHQNSQHEFELSEDSQLFNKPSVTVLSEVNYFEDTSLRTQNLGVCNETLMNPNVKYTIPPFVCNVYDDNFVITVNVKNVDPESIRHRLLQENSGIHIVLSSIGSGFFPGFYALCLKIHENSIVPDTIGVEPWDNNVVFTLRLNDTSEFSRYRVGLDEEFMEVKELPSTVSLTDEFNKLMVRVAPIDCLLSRQGFRITLCFFVLHHAIIACVFQVESPTETDKTIKGKDIVINMKSNSLDTDDEDERLSVDRATRKKERKHGLSKSRSVSESSGDELPTINTSRATRGILKSRRSTFSRSMSESSIDDATGHVSSIELHDDLIHDINSESDCSSFKKSVRFNDVVSRQLYRSVVYNINNAIYIKFSHIRYFMSNLQGCNTCIFCYCPPVSMLLGGMKKTIEMEFSNGSFVFMKKKKCLSFSCQDTQNNVKRPEK